MIGDKYFQSSKYDIVGSTKAVVIYFNLGDDQEIWHNRNIRSPLLEFIQAQIYLEIHLRSLKNRVERIFLLYFPLYASLLLST